MRARQVVIGVALVVGLTVAIPFSIASGTNPSEKALYPLMVLAADLIFLGVPALLYWWEHYVATLLVAPLVGVGAVLLIYTAYLAPGALILTVAGAVGWVRAPTAPM